MYFDYDISNEIYKELKDPLILEFVCNCTNERSSSSFLETLLKDLQ